MHVVCLYSLSMNPQTTPVSQSSSSYLKRTYEPAEPDPPSFFTSMKDSPSSRFKQILEEEEKEKDALRETIRQITKRLKKNMAETKSLRLTANSKLAELKVQVEKEREDPEASYLIELHGVEKPEITDIPDTPNSYRVRYRYLKDKPVSSNEKEINKTKQ